MIAVINGTENRVEDRGLKYSSAVEARHGRGIRDQERLIDELHLQILLV